MAKLYLYKSGDSSDKRYGWELYDKDTKQFISFEKDHIRMEVTVAGHHSSTGEASIIGVNPIPFNELYAKYPRLCIEFENSGCASGQASVAIYLVQDRTLQHYFYLNQNQERKINVYNTPSYGNQLYFLLHHSDGSGSIMKVYNVYLENDEPEYSAKIKSLVKDKILNNKIIQNHIALHESEE